MNNIGERIQQLRLERKLSQDELAAKLNMNRITIGRIERNERPVKDEELAQLAIVLGTTSDYILGLSKKQSYYVDSETSEYAQNMLDDPDYKTLLNGYKNLSKSDLTAVNNIIRSLLNKDESDF